MGRIIGHGRYARETYPSTGGSANAAAAALRNRYLIAASGPGTPSAFTSSTSPPHIVAAVNVTRKASGIFMVSVQVPSTLAASDEQQWEAEIFFGSTASGGVANGDWLLDIASAITIAPAPSGASLMGIYIAQSDTGNLDQSVTLVGVNAAPIPQGSSTIVIAAGAIGSAQITPGQFLAVAYELP